MNEINHGEVLAALLDPALGAIRSQPKDLADAISWVASQGDVDIHDPMTRLIEHLAACGPNDRVRHLLTMRIQSWDHEASPTWSLGTAPHSKERRYDLLCRLGFPETAHEIINQAIPVFTESQVPIVIAENHEPWYEERKRSTKLLYWDHYKAQLARPKGSWSADSIAALNLSTDDVLSRLSDPTRPEIYSVKGLVMGYVQSGKTSHFSGLIAKAADVGYRLVIVLAGTMDILREQTQRRIDKELVGKELLGVEEYGRDADWDKFVQHGGRPSDQGHVDWVRLTDRASDYARLRQHLSVLEFKPFDRSKRFNDPTNLAVSPARLAVIKKTPRRIQGLCDDLERLRDLRNALEHVPTLIIDDESDQASINTIDPKTSGAARLRTSTNKAIGRLLQLLPRAQYIGYTATPFANVFIDPEDASDLFPKDFVVSLPRPEGYMGVADFYDFESRFAKGDIRGNRAAFVRSIEGVNGAEKNLPRAIDSFVLSGAIKLFRQDLEPDEYRFRHHTMLVHHSARKAVHEEDADDVRDIFSGGMRYQREEGLGALRELFQVDFSQVSKVHASRDPFPEDFEVLTPYISECISRICNDKSVLIVNGDNKDDTPDFDQREIWAILVGGAKLSRGYTVEGLTTSYFRRPAGAGDTLMQMGRWFGFRPGYRDLVRLYISENEFRGKKQINLYEAFGALCLDEEALRAELQTYADGDITPKQIPPLVHQHLPYLPPTAKNKMFNARIQSRDFAGQWIEKTSAPTSEKQRKANLGAAARLLTDTRYLGEHNVQFTNGKGVNRAFQTVGAVVSTEKVISFLEDYTWSEGRRSVELELAYTEKQARASAFDQWLILLPQARGTRTFSLVGQPFGDLNCIERSRVSRHRFGVYSEPRHREAAAALAGVVDVHKAGVFIPQFRNDRQPVLVLYLVDEPGKAVGNPSVGFGIQYTGKRIETPITWTVVDRSRGNDVVVSVEND
jgi:hypothetical protein